ncbi:hypothetical protein ACNKHV_22750 [Shigella flexneri]
MKVIQTEGVLDNSQDESGHPCGLIAQLIWRVATVRPLPSGILALDGTRATTDGL